MKKILSVIMAILVLSTVFVFSASAEACGCEDHTNAAEGCHCCAYCENIDNRYLTHCLRAPDGTRENPVEACCIRCTGIRPCSCGCDCCALSDEDLEANDKQPILTPEQQETVVDAFQSVLSRVREFFDKIFDAIFEFLRFDEIMGNN